MRRLAAGLVVLQLLLLAALLFEPRGSWWPLDPPALIVAAMLAGAGFVIAVWGIVGLGHALTASPIPRPEASLVTHGVYGLVRNPIYSGLMLGGLGLVVFGASWWHLATWVALVVLLAVKTRWEERMLVAAHPEFDDYAQRVGRFLPRVGRWPPAC
jgi:protein-S-isoprenylcysteine O-methyltransferase Ste14